MARKPLLADIDPTKCGWSQEVTGTVKLLIERFKHIDESYLSRIKQQPRGDKRSATIECRPDPAVARLWCSSGTKIEDPDTSQRRDAAIRMISLAYLLSIQNDLHEGDVFVESFIVWQRQLVDLHPRSVDGSYPACPIIPSFPLEQYGEDYWDGVLGEPTERMFDFRGYRWELAPPQHSWWQQITLTNQGGAKLVLSEFTRRQASVLCLLMDLVTAADAQLMPMRRTCNELMGGQHCYLNCDTIPEMVDATDWHRNLYNLYMLNYRDVRFLHLLLLPEELDPRVKAARQIRETLYLVGAAVGVSPPLLNIIVEYV